MAYRQQAPFAVVCRESGEPRLGRFFLQFTFPGMEEAREAWDHVALGARLDLDLYLEPDLDGLAASFEGVQVQSALTWLRADLPAETRTAWLALRGVEGSGAAPLPVWEVPLYEADFEATMMEEICAQVDCLDPALLAPAARQALGLEGPMPVLGPGEAAHGIAILDVWTMEGAILVNDNLHGQDFLPQRRSDPWLMIEIAAATQRLEDLYLLYPAADGTYALLPTDPVALYRGDGGEIAVRYGVQADVRSATQGLGLLSALPRGVPLERVRLVLGGSGPAWRLR